METKVEFRFEDFEKIVNSTKFGTNFESISARSKSRKVLGEESIFYCIVLNKKNLKLK